MQLVPLLNDTKWEEIRVAMLELIPMPKWRTRDLESGHESGWDREWHYHFSEGGYARIEWLEIEKRSDVLAALQVINVPGHVEDDTILVLGYCKPGEAVEYL